VLYDAVPLMFKTNKLKYMNTLTISRKLSQFHGTAEYHKHLFPGRPALLITDGCKYVRDCLNANWLFDALLSYQAYLFQLKVSFQVWELIQLKRDLSWQLTCRSDTGKKPLVIQNIEFSDFPLEYIKIWVIDKVALLPSEY
jgi:hypothetical protein